LKLKGAYFNTFFKALPNVQTYQKFIFILSHDTYQVLQDKMKKKDGHLEKKNACIRVHFKKWHDLTMVNYMTIITNVVPLR